MSLALAVLLALSGPLDLKTIVTTPLPALKARWGKPERWETWIWRGPKGQIPTFDQALAFDPAKPSRPWRLAEYGLVWQGDGLKRDKLQKVVLQFKDGKPWRLNVHTLLAPWDGSVDGLEADLQAWMLGPKMAGQPAPPFSPRTRLQTSEGTWNVRVHPRLGDVNAEYFAELEFEGDTPPTPQVPTAMNEASCTLGLDFSGKPEEISYDGLPKAKTIRQSLKGIGPDPTKAQTQFDGSDDSLAGFNDYPLPGWIVGWGSKAPSWREETGSWLYFRRNDSSNYHRDPHQFIECGEE